MILRGHRDPTEPWLVRETAFDPTTIAHGETIFTVANGFLGLRGNLDEAYPAYQHGTFLNGFYETVPISYPEDAYGYARTDQEMLSVPDGKVIRLWVDGDRFDVTTGRLVEHHRTLDLRRGLMTREARWSSPRGREVRVRSVRFVSTATKSLAVIRYEVEVLDGRAPIVVASELATGLHDDIDPGDPRSAGPITSDALTQGLARRRGHRAVLGHTTQHSRMRVVSGMDHVIDAGPPVELREVADDRIVAASEIGPGTPLRLTKYLAYAYTPDGSYDELAHEVDQVLDKALATSYDDHLAAHAAALAEYWEDHDVVVEGNPELQLAVRFALFELLQASVQVDETGIPAKGLTGLGYKGQYFWDQETYVLGALTYLNPEATASVLRYRHKTLPAARDRARVVSEEGALFPWRTIGGEAASAYFPAGTAAYHIDADVAHAVDRYLDATGDETFLDRYGAEIYVETARLWFSLGFFNERRDGRFCIHDVTGPDEYTAVVHNNFYTNVMARWNLQVAADVVGRLGAERPEAFHRLAEEIGLTDEEVSNWRRAAASMYLPYDERLGVHAQDDTFLELEPWDFANTPKDHYPLLLHFHPLVIYRHKVIKQADVVMALFLRGEEFSHDQKRRDFDYYDPLTTGDSSLSASVQAIVAAEVGHIPLAEHYLMNGALVDLDDRANNVRDGIHVAAVAGTWLALVHGFGGMRTYRGRLSFSPRLPTSMDRLAFSIRYQGRHLGIDIGPDATTYTLRHGEPMAILHVGHEIELRAGSPETTANAHERHPG